MAEYAGLDCLDTAEGETKGEGTTEEEFEPDKSRLRKFRDSAMDALHNWDKLRFQAARHRGTRLSPSRDSSRETVSSHKRSARVH